MDVEGTRGMKVGECTPFAPLSTERAQELEEIIRWLLPLIRGSQGAESADIGKLDAVDKSDDDLWMGAICAECENGDRPYQLHGEWIHALSEGDVPCPAMPVFKIVQQLRERAESGVEMGKVNRVEEKCAKCGHSKKDHGEFGDDECGYPLHDTSVSTGISVYCKCRSFRALTDEKSGSAETGGEKE